MYGMTYEHMRESMSERMMHCAQQEAYEHAYSLITSQITFIALCSSGHAAIRHTGASKIHLSRPKTEKPIGNTKTPQKSI